MIASYLHVKFERDGIERMRLALPPRAAENLRQLIPPQLAEQARTSGVDLESVENGVRDGDYSPRELVNLDNEDGRHITIWLE